MQAPEQTDGFIRQRRVTFRLEVGGDTNRLLLVQADGRPHPPMRPWQAWGGSKMAFGRNGSRVWGGTAPSSTAAGAQPSQPLSHGARGSWNGALGPRSPAEPGATVGAAFCVTTEACGQQPRPVMDLGPSVSTTGRMPHLSETTRHVRVTRNEEDASVWLLDALLASLQTRAGLLGALRTFVSGPDFPHTPF